MSTDSQMHHNLRHRDLHCNCEMVNHPKINFCDRNFHTSS